MTAREPPDRKWRKSPFSDTDHNCVEYAVADERGVGYVAFRDSKNPTGGEFVLSPDGVRGIVEWLKSDGE